MKFNLPVFAVLAAVTHAAVLTSDAIQKSSSNDRIEQSYDPNAKKGLAEDIASFRGCVIKNAYQQLAQNGCANGSGDEMVKCICGDQNRLKQVISANIKYCLNQEYKNGGLIRQTMSDSSDLGIGAICQKYQSGYNG